MLRNIQFGVLGKHAHHADDRICDLGDPNRTLRKTLADLARGQGRGAELRWRVGDLGHAAWSLCRVRNTLFTRFQEL